MVEKPHSNGEQRKSLVSPTHPALRDLKSPSADISVASEPDVGSRAKRSWIAKASPRANTIWVWIIALSPTLQIILLWTLAGVGIETTWLSIYVMAFIGLIVNLFLANLDQLELNRRGFDHLASKYWALLPPVVYLALRGNRIFNQAGRGLEPFWLHVSQAVLLPVLGLVVTLWGGAVMQLSR